MVYRGKSIAIDPTGQIIAGPASENQNDILCADLDREKIRELRNRRPRPMNLRPESKTSSWESPASTGSPPSSCCRAVVLWC